MDTPQNYKPMARLEFLLSVYNEITDPGLSSNSQVVKLSVRAGWSGSPQYRVDGGAWQNLNLVSGRYESSWVSSLGSHSLEYRDENGVRPVADFTVFSEAEIACLSAPQNFVFWNLSVEATGIKVLGYPSTIGEVSVNAGAFKSWNSANGAQFLDGELAGLDGDDSIDDIFFRTTIGACIPTAFQDVYIGEDAVQEFGASYIKSDCTATGANDGAIDVTVTGGSGSYSFEWSDGPVTEDRAGLAPGSYTITITDTVSLESIILANIQITEPSNVSEDLTEEITIQVRTPSCANAVYLCWLNSLGGWDHWLFEDLNGSFENDLTTRTNEEFSRYVEKLDEVQSVSDHLSKTVRRSMRLGTGELTISQIAGFSELFTSAKVLMLTSSPDVRPPEWMGVKVKDGSFRYNEQTQESEVTIELPDFNIQTS